MDLYSEIILDYFKNPKNKGCLKNATHGAEESNPLCGDKIKIHLLLDKTKKVKKATFEGEGCAISQATASMLTETLIGKTFSQIQKLKPSDIEKMLGIKITPARLKCATLALTTAKKATQSNNI